MSCFVSGPHREDRYRSSCESIKQWRYEYKAHASVRIITRECIESFCRAGPIGLSIREVFANSTFLFPAGGADARAGVALGALGGGLAMWVAAILFKAAGGARKAFKAAWGDSARPLFLDAPAKKSANLTGDMPD